MYYENSCTSERKISEQECFSSERFIHKKKIYLYNDDYTPRCFVINILMKVFDMDLLKSKRISQYAHLNGKAFCGAYSKDIADTMSCQAMELAKEAGYPLLLSVY